MANKEVRSVFEERVAEMNRSPDAVPAAPQCEKRVYTVDELMDILQISKTTAYALVNSGVFHSVRIGGQHRISKKSFDAWLDEEGGQVCD